MSYQENPQFRGPIKRATSRLGEWFLDWQRRLGSTDALEFDYPFLYRHYGNLERYAENLGIHPQQYSPPPEKTRIFSNNYPQALGFRWRDPDYGFPSHELRVFCDANDANRWKRGVSSQVSVMNADGMLTVVHLWHTLPLDTDTGARYGLFIDEREPEGKHESQRSFCLVAEKSGNTYYCQIHPVVYGDVYDPVTIMHWPDGRVFYDGLPQVYALAESFGLADSAALAMADGAIPLMQAMLSGELSYQCQAETPAGVYRQISGYFDL